jgi:hypothetical protein
MEVRKYSKNENTRYWDATHQQLTHGGPAAHAGAKSCGWRIGFFLQVAAPILQGCIILGFGIMSVQMRCSTPHTDIAA